VRSCRKKVLHLVIYNKIITCEYLKNMVAYHTHRRIHHKNDHIKDLFHLSYKILAIYGALQVINEISPCIKRIPAGTVAGKVALHE
jgi:hypothetical protein